MRRTFILLFCTLSVLLGAGSASGQNWQKVATLPSRGTCAFFFNANEGMIGTGDYQRGGLAEIYYTTDGGATWTPSVMPNPVFQGGVNDIYFADRLHGWAAVSDINGNVTGWSGIYRTTDGGLSWQLKYPTPNPTSVRETGTGVYFTDRYSGIWYSNNAGNTFSLVATSSGSLCLDFLSNQECYSTGEAAAISQHLVTTSAPAGWSQNPQVHEAWTVYADRISNWYYYSSERDNGGGTGPTVIMVSKDRGASFMQVWGGQAGQITGGIAGWRGCKDIIYQQAGSEAMTPLPSGLMRSMDGGGTWQFVGGPFNQHDTRFAVTGRGAVVYASDGAGGVWKTMNGGDGSLSPSILKLTTEQALSNSIVSAAMCDSAPAQFAFRYNSCDSASIAGVTFVDDALGECSVGSDLRSLGSFSQSHQVTLQLIFHPQALGQRTIHSRITLRQPDGYLEDTILSQTFQGNPSRAKFEYSTSTIPALRSIDFGSENICTGDSAVAVTITNLGCASSQITNIRTIGSAFTLVSAFNPITLDPANARTYLLRFKPSALVPVPQTGSLIVSTTLGIDTILLTGIGIPGATGFSLSQPLIAASLCDSITATVSLHNLSCSAATIDSIEAGNPLTILGFSASTVQSDGLLPISVKFVPTLGSQGVQQQSITIHAHLGTVAFDTTLMLTTNGTPAGPSATLSTTQVDFGNVTLCQSATKKIIVTAGGCGALTINSTTLDSSAFLAIGGTATTLTSGSSDTILVTFTPSPSRIGAYSGTMIVHTNAGDESISLAANGVSDNGQVTLSVADTTTLACETGNLSLFIVNSTCDSVWVDSITVGGVDPFDFSFPSFLKKGYASSEIDTVRGVFVPQSSGIRTATATVHIRREDGTLVDQVLSISVNAIGQTPIRVVVPESTIVAQVQQRVRIPMYALDSSVIPITQLVATIAMNTNLLNPQSFDVSTTQLAGATVGLDQSLQGKLTITATIPAGVMIKKGILGWISCTADVTDTISTPAFVQAANFTNNGLPIACLSTQPISDSITTFTLSPQCGDLTTTAALANHLGIFVGSITPNPARDHIFITLTITKAYQNDGTLEVSDELGHLLDSRRLSFPEGTTTETLDLPLSGSSGSRYIRVISNQGVMTRRVIVQK